MPPKDIRQTPRAGHAHFGARGHESQPQTRHHGRHHQSRLHCPPAHPPGRWLTQAQLTPLRTQLLHKHPELASDLSLLQGNPPESTKTYQPVLQFLRGESQLARQTWQKQIARRKSGPVLPGLQALFGQLAALRQMDPAGGDRPPLRTRATPVTVYRLVAQDTLEERVLSLHAHKRELAQSVLEGRENEARLNAAKLLALLQA